MQYPGRGEGSGSLALRPFSIANILVALWLVAGTLSLRALAEPTALEKADAILAEATSLEDFLSSNERVGRYYQAINELYGGNVPPASFQTILTQLKSAAEKVPGFKEAVWKARTGPGFIGTFRIRPGMEITGLVTGWNFTDKFRQKVLDPLRDDVAGLGEGDAAANAARILAEAKGRVLTFRHYLETLPGGKKAKGAATGQFLKALSDDPQVKAATAYLLLQRLESPEVRTRLSSGEADIIFQSLEELRTGTGVAKWSDLGAGEVPDELLRLVTDRLPTKTEMTQEYGFNREMRKARSGRNVEVGSVSRDEIVVTPIHPLHALFKGICLQECVGGGKDNLSTTTPERWATSVLPGAQVFALTQNGRYQGWMMSVPMKGPKGATYLALDRGAGILRNKAWVPDSDTGSWNQTTLFELFVHELNARRPAGTRGVVVSDSDYGDAADVRSTILNSPSYQSGAKLGGRGGFVHLDPAFVKAIVAISPTNGHAGSYGGNFIFDVVNKDTNTVTLLTETQAEWDAEVLRNAPVAQKIAALNEVFRQTRQTDELTNALAARLTLLANDPDPTVRALVELLGHELVQRRRELDPQSKRLLDHILPRLPPFRGWNEYEHLDSDDVRQRAAEVARLASNPTEFYRLLYQGRSQREKLKAAEALKSAVLPGVLGAVALLNDPDPVVRERALIAVLWLQRKGTVPPEVARTLPAQPPALHELARTALPENRTFAYIATADVEGPRATVNILFREDSDLKKAQTLDEIRGPHIPEPRDLYYLEALLKDPGSNPLLLGRAQIALHKMYDRTKGGRGNLDAPSRILLDELLLTAPSLYTLMESPIDAVRGEAEDTAEKVEGQSKLSAWKIRRRPRELKLQAIQDLRENYGSPVGLLNVELSQLAGLVEDPDPEIRDLARLTAVEVWLRHWKKNLELNPQGDALLRERFGVPRPSPEDFFNSPYSSVRNAARDLAAARDRDFAPTCAENFAAFGRFFAQRKLLSASLATGLTVLGGAAYEWSRDWQEWPFRYSRESARGRYTANGAPDNRRESIAWDDRDLDWDFGRLDKLLYLSTDEQAATLRGLKAEQEGLRQEMSPLLEKYPKNGWTDSDSFQVDRLRRRQKALYDRVVSLIRELEKWR